MSELPHATSDLVQSPGPGLPATKITPPWFGWIQRVERLMRGLDSDITAVETEVAGLVIDSIADSDTTHAPSRNAVFDALALKLDVSAALTRGQALQLPNLATFY